MDATHENEHTGDSDDQVLDGILQMNVQHFNPDKVTVKR